MEILQEGCYAYDMIHIICGGLTTVTEGASDVIFFFNRRMFSYSLQFITSHFFLSFATSKEHLWFVVFRVYSRPTRFNFVPLRPIIYKKFHLIGFLMYVGLVIE
jgi:hypothetical protein